MVATAREMKILWAQDRNTSNCQHAPTMCSWKYSSSIWIWMVLIMNISSYNHTQQGINGIC